MNLEFNIHNLDTAITSLENVTCSGFQNHERITSAMRAIAVVRSELLKAMTEEKAEEKTDAVSANTSVQ